MAAEDGSPGTDADSAAVAEAAAPVKATIYKSIIEWIFADKHTPGSKEVPFQQNDIDRAVGALKLEKGPTNQGDVIYTYRYRRDMPASIQTEAPLGMAWIIRGRGPGEYSFVAVDETLLDIKPTSGRPIHKIPSATPSLVTERALSSEQALLAIVRYNRLVDLFTGVTCYSLQNHLRTQVPGIGQVETDEVYVGVDQFGAQYVFPVEAKGGGEKLGIVQIEQDVALCLSKFPDMRCRPIGAQFLRGDPTSIVLFEFADIDGMPVVANERHYRLVDANSISPGELAAYLQMADNLRTSGSA